MMESQKDCDDKYQIYISIESQRNIHIFLAKKKKTFGPLLYTKKLESKSAFKEVQIEEWDYM